jgi:photosystem II stability/assembly factor-like uncharacterized protein
MIMKRQSIILFCSILLINLKFSSAQEWTLLSPKPTYKPIRSLSFPSADTGYMVTDDSKVMRTFDGGESWNDLNFQDDALYVEFTNNHRGYITSFDKIYSTDDAGETWQPHLVESMVSCWETYFYNDTTGFAFGWAGYMAKTTDGGNTWERKQSYPGSGTFYYTEMEFADLNTGYAVGEFEHKNTVLRRTDDGGNNWVDISIPPIQGYVTSVAVLSPDDIWIGTGLSDFEPLPCPATVYHSTDGGITWTSHVVGETYELPDAVTRIHFFDQLQGFAMNSRQIFLTSDGGQTWNHVFIDPMYEVSINLSEYSWPDPQHGYFAGSGPSLIKTSDGGLTYTNLIEGPIDRYRAIYFIDTLHGIVAGFNSAGSSMVYTENGGDTWQQASFDSVPAFIGAVAFADNENGWATTGKGVYRTHDGGHNWNIVYQGVDDDFYGITSPDYGHLYAYGNGSISKSSDGGSTWMDITPGSGMDGYYTTAFQFPDSLTGYIGLKKVSDNAGRFMKTSDGGLTWTDIFLYNNKALRSLNFCDPLNGIVSQEGGRVFTTHDGGETWAQASITVEYVKMIDPQTALIAMAGRKVAVSHDGGVTFNTVYTNEDNWPYVHQHFFLDETLGFAAGYNGMIQRYDAISTGIKEPGLPPAASFRNPVFSPNPANDRIKVLVADYERITITAMDGSVVTDLAGTSGSEINISSLKPGIYLVILELNNGKIAQKLVKY